MSRSVALWLAVLLLFAGGMAVWAGIRMWQGRAPAPGSGPADPNETIVLDSKPLEEFTLVERSGKVFRSRELAGKVWIASFFYASCPGFCRKQNDFIAELVREYGSKGVHFVSITVDPARDTPSVLSSYADRLQANPDQWHFLTGQPEYILRVGRDVFHVSVDLETHSNRLVLVGRDGKIVGQYISTDKNDIAELREMLDHLLAPPAPTPAAAPIPAAAPSTAGEAAQEPAAP